MQVALTRAMKFGSSTPLGHLTCPTCSAIVPAMDGSSVVIAWYACRACGSLWSARIRGGHPTDPIVVDTVTIEDDLDA